MANVDEQLHPGLTNSEESGMLVIVSPSLMAIIVIVRVLGLRLVRWIITSRRQNRRDELYTSKS